MIWRVRTAVAAVSAATMAATIWGLGLGMAAFPAKAEPVIDITKGVVEPMPIAVPTFGGTNPTDDQLGAEIARVVAADLERSGLFAPIDERAFIQRDLTSDSLPRFQDWRLINAQALVAGSIKPGAGGKYSVEFRLWDVDSGQQLTGQPAQHHAVQRQAVELGQGRRADQRAGPQQQPHHGQVGQRGQVEEGRLLLADGEHALGEEPDPDP